MSDAVLLIGGDLCQHVAADLSALQWTIWGLRRKPPIDTSIRWIQVDLTSPDKLRGVLPDVTHVLYAPAPDRRDRASYQATYPLGIRNLLDALPNPDRLRRFVLVGSTVVWPASGTADSLSWVDETTPVCARGFRSEAILQAEEELFKRLPGRGVVIRFGGIYGPGRARLIDALRGCQLVAPSGPGHWSNRIHIDDAARACAHLLELADPAPCYVGTDGHPADTAAFYDQLADLLGVPRPTRRVMPPSGKRLSNARLIGSGWTPRWPDALAGYRSLLQA